MRVACCSRNTTTGVPETLAIAQRSSCRQKTDESRILYHDSRDVMKPYRGFDIERTLCGTQTVYMIDGFGFTSTASSIKLAKARIDRLHDALGTPVWDLPKPEERKKKRDAAS
jgi:hypothetical protein